jgi:hypothetical protein
MTSRRQPKQNERFFCVFWFEDSEVVFAAESEPISVAQARQCGGCDCGGKNGVFLKELGVMWHLTDEIAVSKYPSTQIHCQSCQIQEPITYPGPRGREDRSPRHMVFLVRNNEDLLLQVRLWKSGQKFLRTVRTKHGDIAVFRKKPLEVEPALLTCPHCKQSIEVMVKESYSN